MSSSLLVFAGPSGGHLFPAVAFAEEWRSRYPSSRIHLVTSRKAQSITAAFPAGLFERVILWENFPSPSGMSLRTAGFLIKLGTAFVKSACLLRDIHPDLSIGFGSYVSFPGIAVSSWSGVPTLIHEQNVVPGKATRWLAPYADKIAVTFETTRGLEHYNAKMTVTGLPVRKALVEAAGTKRSSGSGTERTRILVTGGSQGASFLNKTILNAFSLLSPEEKKQIAVIHITGNKEYESVRKMYESSGVENEVHPFFEKMEECLMMADIAVTRAGANTLFELALYEIPAIVIPYPYAGAHQGANADYFAAKGALVCEKEETLTSGLLLTHLRGMIRNREVRKKMQSSLKSIITRNAAKQLVLTAEKLTGEKKND